MLLCDQQLQPARSSGLRNLRQAEKDVASGHQRVFWRFWTGIMDKAVELVLWDRTYHVMIEHVM